MKSAEFLMGMIMETAGTVIPSQVKAEAILSATLRIARASRSKLALSSFEDYIPNLLEKQRLSISEPRAGRHHVRRCIRLATLVKNLGCIPPTDFRFMAFS